MRLIFSLPERVLRRSAVVGPLFILGSLASGCVGIPELPSERELPVQAIVLNAVCELRDAFVELSNKKHYPKFSADEWAASIALTPKIDTDLNASFGHTGKSTTVSSAPRFWTWALSPAAGLNVKGHNDATTTYVVATSQLVGPKAKPLRDCPEHKGSQRNLTHHLGLLEWWQRVIPDHDADLAALARIDKAAFNQSILVKFSAGAGSATYTIVPNTYTATASNSYQREYLLSIAFTTDPKKQKVQTLPDGGILAKGGREDQGPVSAQALNRLDNIQQENVLRNLRLQPN